MQGSCGQNPDYGRGKGEGSMKGETLFEINNINKCFPGNHHVLRDISFTLYPRDTVGLMGKSGGGKTTLAKIMVGLLPCDSGRILYRGRDLLTLDRRGMRALRPKLQMVFQDYRQSLPPHLRVGDILTEALIVNELATKGEADHIVKELMKSAGLSQSHIHKYPRQLSGGEAQRIALVRALELKPDLLILDEVTSGLDSKTAARILDLVYRLREGEEMAVLIISHDPELIRSQTDKILVLEGGRLKE